jgi:hypothetical protein
MLEFKAGKIYSVRRVKHMAHIRLPHSAVVRSPGLLPMLYTVSEIAAALSVPERTLRDWLDAGAPHERDQKRHIWVHGRKFAAWVAEMREPVKRGKLQDDEAYCMRCNQAVRMSNASTKAMQGKLILIRGTCPNCGCTINRGGRLPTYSLNQTNAKETNHAK